MSQAVGTDHRKVLFTQNPNKPPVKLHLPSIQMDSSEPACQLGGKQSHSQSDFGHETVV